MGRGPESVKAEEDDTAAKDEEEPEGRIWRVQAHARSAVTAIKIDPVDGSKVNLSGFSYSNSTGAYQIAIFILIRLLSPIHLIPRYNLPRAFLIRR